MAVTLKDIAKRTGKSICAVSVVLNGSSGSPVSEATRRKILAAAREMGYKRNRSSRGRMARKGVAPKRIGIISYGEGPWGRAYHAIMADAVREAVIAAGHEVAFAHSRMELHNTRLLCRAVKGVGGIISSQFLGDELGDRLLGYVPRIACVGSSTLLDDRLTHVTIDYARAVRNSVEHLYRLGHRRIAYVISSNPKSPRVREYLRLMGEQEFEWCKEYLQRDATDGESRFDCSAFAEAAVEKLFSLRRPPTAVLAFDEDVSVETLRYVTKRGLRVPEDVAIVGFDHSGHCLRTHPRLTAVRLPRREIARMAVKLIVEQIEENSVKPITVFVPAPLVVRESCGGSANDRPKTEKGRSVASIVS